MNSLLQKFINNPSSLSDEEARTLLQDLRAEVDTIDIGIVRLLLKRIDLSLNIGRIKNFLGEPSYNPAREIKILEDVISHTEDELSRSIIRNIYERIIDESRGIQKLRSNDE
jgi:chorismate mutase